MQIFMICGSLTVQELAFLKLAVRASMIVSDGKWKQLSKGVRGRKVGQDFEYELEKPAIKLTFANVHDDRSGVWAELRLESLEAGNAGHLLSDHLTLTSSRSRESFAKTIARRTKAEMEWDKFMELVCLVTVDTFRNGEPFVFLKDVALDPESRFYLIQDYLPYRQPTVIYGDGMSGKSLLALTMCLAAATGMELSGIVPKMKSQNVLYLDWETMAENHRYYLQMLECGLGLDIPPHVISYRRMYRPMADEASRVKQIVDEREIGLVVLDSMVPACGGEPESAEVVMNFFNSLRSLGAVTSLIISHITKAEAQKRGQPRPFGSVFTTNLARSTWLARRAIIGQDNKLAVGLYHTKTNFGKLFEPRALEYTFYDTEITLRSVEVEGLSELASHIPLSQRIRGVLKRDANTIGDLAEMLGASSDSIGKAIRRMPDTIEVDEETDGPGRPRKVWGLKSNNEPTS